MLTRSANTVDNKTSIKHASPDCTSNQNYQAIVKDNAKGSYLSKTHVDSVAQKTEGYQLSKGILLSPNADNPIPQSNLPSLSDENNFRLVCYQQS